MDQGNEKYKKDYEALLEMLSHYPAISIVSTEKDPPEQYVLEYKLFGYGYDAKGEVQMLRRHLIQINLPFGYPHFPPTVKPLSKICHPDMAEHAVRIADYWQNNKSLADLVVHIGNMIRGEVYSTEAAFNQQAADWYQANRHKLPLAELEYYDPNSVKKPEKEGMTLPFARIAGALVLGLVVVGGGLVYRDKRILVESAEMLLQARDDISQRRFQEARETGRNAVESLQGILFLRSAGKAREAELVGVLESETLQEGLAGKVEYQGHYLPIVEADTLREVEKLKQEALHHLQQGDIDAAGRAFSDAVELAEKNGLREGANGVRRVSATERLEYYVKTANSEYSEQRWQEAADDYGQAVAILQNESAFLSDEARAALEKLEKLRILARVNVLKIAAAAAEKKEKFQQAAEMYREIALLAGQSPYAADPVLTEVAVEAEGERARVSEQAQIVAGSTYLLENYREIFIRHYPGLNEEALQSPRVRFMGRNDGNLVFIMSCIELIQRHSNEFRLYYQYDPATREWSIYREQK